jgi:DNA-binding MarR family transcriptional regulator
MKFEQQSLDWIGLRLSVVSNRYTYPLYAKIERHHKLLRDEAAVIICLSVASAATAQEIVKYTGRPKNTLSRAVRKLEAEGIISRETDANDGRVSRLHLTQRGNRIFVAIRGYFVEQDKRMIAVLTDKEKREFNRLLGKIADASTQWASP